jgi:hypothetical protein
MTNGDDGFLSHYGLQIDCINSIEQQNLYNAATPAQRRRGIDPPRPVFEILNEFIDEKMLRIAKQDRTKAFLALRDLCWVLRDLVRGVKHPELKPLLKIVEATRAELAEVLRQQLVKDYRNPATPREDLPIINKTLVYIIECGGWPTWQEDIAQWGMPERGDDDDDCAA